MRFWQCVDVSQVTASANPNAYHHWPFVQASSGLVLRVVQAFRAGWNCDLKEIWTESDTLQ